MVFVKYYLLQWLIIVFGVGMAAFIVIQVQKLFMGVDEEMWENRCLSNRYIKERLG